MATLPKLNKPAQSLAAHATDFDLWLACHTQQEIAEAVGMTQRGIDVILEETAKLPKLLKSAQSLATHATDFDPLLSSTRFIASGTGAT